MNEAVDHHMGNILIRRAENKDRAVVRLLVNQLFDELVEGTHDIKVLDNLARRRMEILADLGSYKAWLAESDGCVLGIAVSIDQEFVIHLAVLYVIPSIRKNGLGTELLMAVLNDVPTGNTVITEALSPLASFYVARGFTQDDHAPWVFRMIKE